MRYLSYRGFRRAALVEVHHDTSDHDDSRGMEEEEEEDDEDEEQSEIDVDDDHSDDFDSGQGLDDEFSDGDMDDMDHIDEVANEGDEEEDTDESEESDAADILSDGRDDEFLASSSEDASHDSDNLAWKWDIDIIYILFVCTLTLFTILLHDQKCW